MASPQGLRPGAGSGVSEARPQACAQGCAVIQSENTEATAALLPVGARNRRFGLKKDDVPGPRPTWTHFAETHQKQEHKPYRTPLTGGPYRSHVLGQKGEGGTAGGGGGASVSQEQTLGWEDGKILETDGKRDIQHDI